MKKSTKSLFFTLLTTLGFASQSFGQTAPVADFSWTPTSPCTGATVQVTDQSTPSGSITAWGYSVTGATMATYTVQNPVVTFTAGGTQTITQVVVMGVNFSAPVSKTIEVIGLAVSSTTNNLCIGSSATITASGSSSYTWAPGSQTTSAIVVSPTVNTTYTVSEGTCSLTVAFTQSVQNCSVGIKKQSAGQVSFGLYPNPTSGDITIELNNGAVKSVQVIDMTGRTVYSNILSADKSVINLSALAKGIYYVRVQSNNNVEVAKLVKE